LKVEHVDITSLENGKTYDALSYEDFKTPEKLVGSPYLFSVNTYQQYTDLMIRLGDIFGDRALAGLFLAEFNRSCSSSMRKKELCSSYSYSIR
jgi:hypothetical protein